MKRVTIPRHWSAEQALSVVAFLDDVIRAIWREHGEQMADVLRRDVCRPVEETEPSRLDDDDLPF